MKVVTVDQFEFENPSTEEFVEIVIAQRSHFPFPSVRDFVAARLGLEVSASLPASGEFDQCPGCQQARQHLSKFADLSLPEACLWETYRFSSGPDEWSFVVCSPTHFIHYQWGTSA